MYTPFVQGLPTKAPSRIANRRTQSAAQLRAARTQRLLELSQRQLAHSREAQASRKSLGASERSMSSRRSLQLTEANVKTGMVLPFEPMIMTFQDVNYFVPLPPVRLEPKRANLDLKSHLRCQRPILDPLSHDADPRRLELMTCRIPFSLYATPACELRIFVCSAIPSPMGIRSLTWLSEHDHGQQH